MDEYQEQYTQTGAGLVQMESERPYIIAGPDGQETVHVFKVVQNLKFATCPHENDTEIGESWTLKVGRNFISYEAREQIIRFGISNKISPFGGKSAIINQKLDLKCVFFRLRSVY